MKTFTKVEWNNIEEGKLTKDLTVEEFKSNFGISDEEFESSLKTSQSNEYGTTDATFSDEEGDTIVAEIYIDNSTETPILTITHIYKH